MHVSDNPPPYLTVIRRKCPAGLHASLSHFFSEQGLIIFFTSHISGRGNGIRAVFLCVFLCVCVNTVCVSQSIITKGLLGKRGDMQELRECSGVFILPKIQNLIWPVFMPVDAYVYGMQVKWILCISGMPSSWDCLISILIRKVSLTVGCIHEFQISVMLLHISYRRLIRRFQFQTAMELFRIQSGELYLHITAVYHVYPHTIPRVCLLTQTHFTLFMVDRCKPLTFITRLHYTLSTPVERRILFI